MAGEPVEKVERSAFAAGRSGRDEGRAGVIGRRDGGRPGMIESVAFACMIVMSATVVCLYAWQWVKGVATLRQDVVFYVVSLQAFVYLFLAPTLYAMTELANVLELCNLYALLQTACLILFILPLTASYRFFKRRLDPSGRRTQRPLTIRPLQQCLLLATAVI